MEQRELYRGGSPVPNFLTTPQMPWAELGTITAQQDYPADNARSYDAVIALSTTKRIIWDLHNLCTGFMLRFQTNADANAHVVSLLGFANPKTLVPDSNPGATWIADHALFLGSLTLTGGTQVGAHSNVFVDSIVATDGIWSFGVMDHATNRIAVARGDTKGIKVMVAIATTLHAASTLYIEGRTY